MTLPLRSKKANLRQGQAEGKFFSLPKRIVEKNFTKVPVEISTWWRAQRPNLTPTAWAVLEYLIFLALDSPQGKYLSWASISCAAIGRIFGIPERRNVLRAIQELEEKGYINTFLRGTVDRQAPVYHIPQLEIFLREFQHNYVKQNEKPSTRVKSTPVQPAQVSNPHPTRVRNAENGSSNTCQTDTPYAEVPNTELFTEGDGVKNKQPEGTGTDQPENESIVETSHAAKKSDEQSKRVRKIGEDMPPWLTRARKERTNAEEESANSELTEQSKQSEITP